MKTKELIRYSRKIIKGRRREMLFICMIPAGGELFFLAAEAALYSVMLYFGAVTPMGLFTGENPEQLVTAGIFAVLRGIVMPPLICAAAGKLLEAGSGRNRKISVSELLLDGKFLRRSIFSGIYGRIAAIALLVPGAFLVRYGFKLMSDGSDSAELFAVSVIFTAAAVFVILWAKLRLSLMAVPFILWEFPDISAFRAVFSAPRFMLHRTKLPLRLMLAYFIPAAAVVTAPIAIPEAGLAMAVGMSIYFKEDEEEKSGKACIYGRFRNSGNRAEISPGKMRSFPGAAEKAEKS